VAQQEQKKPNIFVIMADDIDIWNISAYRRRNSQRPVCSGTQPRPPLDKDMMRDVEKVNFHPIEKISAFLTPFN
jgi:arylsulfatase A-like enzyme